MQNLLFSCKCRKEESARLMQAVELLGFACTDCRLQHRQGLVAHPWWSLNRNCFGTPGSSWKSLQNQTRWCTIAAWLKVHAAEGGMWHQRHQDLWILQHCFPFGWQHVVWHLVHSNYKPSTWTRPNRLQHSLKRWPHGTAQLQTIDTAPGAPRKMSPPGNLPRSSPTQSAWVPRWRPASMTGSWVLCHQCH